MQPHRSGTEALDLMESVGAQDGGAAPVPQPLDTIQAPALELAVSHGQDLVHDQDLRLETGRQGEGKPQHHARGVGLDRPIDLVAKATEFDDPGLAACDLFPGKTGQRASEVEVAPPRELRIETDAQFQQRRHPALEPDFSAAGSAGAGQDLEQSRLPRPIVADDTETLPAPDPKADRLQGREAPM